jgi:hypothetical protein
MSSLEKNTVVKNGTSKFFCTMYNIPCSDSPPNSFLDDTFATDWQLYGHEEHFAITVKIWGLKTQAFLEEYVDYAPQPTPSGSQSQSQATASASTISEVLNGFGLC